MYILNVHFVAILQFFFHDPRCFFAHQFYSGVSEYIREKDWGIERDREK